MSPARDDLLDEIRRATERLNAAGSTWSEADLALQLGMTVTQLQAAMRQIFSEGRRVASDDPSGTSWPDDFVRDRLLQAARRLDIERTSDE
jgi:hypothetical protein